jgi:pyruvate,water dikinase
MPSARKAAQGLTKWLTCFIVRLNLKREVVMEFKYSEPSYGLTYRAFQPRDLEVYPVFFCPLVHQRPLMKPINLWHYSWVAVCGSQVGFETICHPWTKSWDWRVYKGHAYITSVLARSEEEAKQREPVFRERIRPWIEDWDGMYAKYVAEASSLFDPLKTFDLRQATNLELNKYFFKFWEANRRVWEIHFETMVPTMILYGEFANSCREIGIETDDPLFRKLMQGFDNKLFQSNKEQWRLAERAVELKLDNLFLTIEAEELPSALEQSDAGRRWLEELREFLNIWGWRTSNPLAIQEPGWVEKPSLALVGIKQAVESGKPCPLDEVRMRLAAEREEVEKEVLSRVPEARRNMFANLMKAGQRSGFYSEDHLIYFDPPAAALGHRMLAEYGRRYTERGILDEPDDILFLFVDEIRLPILLEDNIDLRPLARSRKQEFEGYTKIEPEIFIGNPEKFGEMAMKDAVLMTLGGPPRVKPELKADLYGVTAARGVVEGVARVIPSIDQIGELQPGEILVTATTGPAWTPAFGIAKAVVTDAGGELAHAMIVSREYGIPCVAGTMEATMKIKTGMKIRVDGDNYAVYILG